MNVIREMKEAGLSHTDIAGEIIAAVSIFAVPLLLLAIGMLF